MELRKLLQAGRPIHLRIELQLAEQFWDKGEFCRGEPYLFFKDLDGYEVEIVFEIPKPVHPKLLVRTLGGDQATREERGVSLE